MSGAEKFDKSQIESRTYDCTTAELAVAIGVRHEAAVIVAINPNVPERGSLPVTVSVVGLGVGADAEKRLGVLRTARGAIECMIRDAEGEVG